jgi:maleate isomerase
MIKPDSAAQLKPNCISQEIWEELVAGDLTFTEIEEKFCEEVAINAGIARDPDALDMYDVSLANARPAREVDPELVSFHRMQQGKRKLAAVSPPEPVPNPGGKRVGLIVPSTNTVMEPDLYRHLPNSVTVHTSRMLLEGSVTVEAEELMLDVYLPECARQIGTLQPDVVVFGCTSAGALRGPAYEQELAEEISRATGAPTVTIMGAVVEELRRLEFNSVAVLTPYSEEINDTIKDSLEASGFTVPYINGMDVRGAFNIAAVTPAEIISYTREQLKGVESDCLFVSCANLRSVEVLGELEAVAGRPVLTSNQAVLECIKRAIAVAV